MGVLCRKLDLEIEQLFSVYVVGSRVWGTATSKSNWEFIIVTDEKEGRISIDNIETYCYCRDKWTNEMKDHRFLPMLTLFLPQSAIWKQECDEDTKKIDVERFVTA